MAEEVFVSFVLDQLCIHWLFYLIGVISTGITAGYS